MEELFRVDRQTLVRYFSQKGWSGNLNEMIIRHFNGLAGARTTDCPKEAIINRLRVLGYANQTRGNFSVKEALDNFFLVKMSGTDPQRCQQLFFANSANDFT